MKKRMLVASALLCVLCLLLWWHWRPPEKPLSGEPPVRVLINASAATETQQEVPQRPTASGPSSAQMPSREPDEVQQSNADYQAVLAIWRVPIDFYGKVVDENSNAVSGASVSFRWFETPSEGDGKTASTQSDAQGLFSLHNKYGQSVEVQIAKEGYYASGGGRASFAYSMNGSFTADRLNPVLFRLRKKGTTEPLIAVRRNYRIPRDGTSVSIDPMTGANTTGEGGSFVVRCWTSDQGKRSGEKYDWRCFLTIPGGGIIPTDQEFPFLAPQGDYKPTAEINMPADRADWKDDVDLKFYYRLADGRYGRMTFSMIAGGHHFCMIDSLLNPTGSRNLEPE